MICPQKKNFFDSLLILRVAAAALPHSREATAWWHRVEAKLRRQAGV